jgi:L-amino acid N-acyltransferase YncA
MADQKWHNQPRDQAMRIRDTLDADLPQIVEIVNSFLSTTTTEWRETEYTLDDRREWLAQHRRVGDPVLVAEINGEVAGFSCYGDFRDSQKWPAIASWSRTRSMSASGTGAAASGAH